MGQLKRIVVGHDLKTGGETALKSAVVLAGRCNAALRLVHVVEAHHLYQRISHPMASKHSLEEIVQQAGGGYRRLLQAGSLLISESNMRCTWANPSSRSSLRPVPGGQT